MAKVTDSSVHHRATYRPEHGTGVLDRRMKKRRIKCAGIKSQITDKSLFGVKRD